MIAASLMGAIMLFVSSYMVNMSKSQSHIQQVSNLQGTMDEIKVLLGNTDRCTHFLQDQLTDQELKVQDVNQGINYAKDQVVNGWKVESITVQEDVDLPDGNKLGKIVLKFKKQNQTTGPQEFVRKLTLDYEPKSINGSEAIDSCQTLANIDIQQTVENLQFPESVCPDGLYSIGFSQGKVICKDIQTTSSSSGGNPYSFSNPGPGCTGANCVTYDFGPCIGAGCKTNGLQCSGANCTALAQ